MKFLDATSSLPKDLYKSSYIDFLLFVGGIKPVVRIDTSSLSQIEQLAMWSRRFKLSSTIRNKFVYIANKNVSVSRIADLDWSCQPHELEFGLELGYPYCCCEFIEKIGEQNIDYFETEVINKGWHFDNEYTLIDPSGYLEGRALISHTPCSPKCKKSLEIAKRSLKIIYRYKQATCMEHWVKWLDRINAFEWL